MARKEKKKKKELIHREGKHPLFYLRGEMKEKILSNRLQPHKEEERKGNLRGDADKLGLQVRLDSCQGEKQQQVNTMWPQMSMKCEVKKNKTLIYFFLSDMEDVDLLPVGSAPSSDSWFTSGLQYFPKASSLGISG